MKLKCYVTLIIALFVAGATDSLARDIGHLHSLVLEPQSGTLLMGTHQGLYESRDEGMSWEKVTAEGNVPGTDFMTMVVDPSNSQTLYAGGHDLAVLKSKDGGKTWRPANKGLPTMDIHALAIDPTKPKRLHAWAVAHGLYRSDNAGDSWFRINDVYAFAFDPWNPDTMYAALREGILTSHDRGKSWTLLDESPKGVVTMVIHPKNTAKLFAGTSAGSIFRSLDKGETWTLQSK